jgi:GNAT superfamily N-acetyltransferase
MAGITFRPARPGEAGLLGDLALRSKAHWGYDQAFLDACRAELSFRPEDVTASRITVAEQSGQVLGFYSLEGQPPAAELGNLWVTPDRIGRGLGRRLWQHAVATAAAAGFAVLRIEADPNAEGFYLAMGARRAGSAPSGAVGGRALPVLCVDLANLARAGRPGQGSTGGG